MKVSRRHQRLQGPQDPRKHCPREGGGGYLGSPPQPPLDSSSELEEKPPQHLPPWEAEPRKLTRLPACSAAITVKPTARWNSPRRPGVGGEGWGWGGVNLHQVGQQLAIGQTESGVGGASLVGLQGGGGGGVAFIKLLVCAQ